MVAHRAVDRKRYEKEIFTVVLEESKTENRALLTRILCLA